MATEDRPGLERSIRVILVDDHAMVRDAVSTLLNRDPRIDIVDTAGTGEAALTGVKSLEPDVVVVDFALPDMTGLDVIRSARAAGATSRFLLLTGSHLNENERETVAQSADGFLHKEAGHQILLDTVLTLSDQAALRAQTGEDVGQVSNIGELTQREREVLREIAAGFAIKDIADHLSISVATVRKHRENTMLKLQANSTAQLVRIAMQAGIH